MKNLGLNIRNHGTPCPRDRAHATPSMAHFICAIRARGGGMLFASARERGGTSKMLFEVSWIFHAPCNLKIFQIMQAKDFARSISGPLR